MLTKRAYAKVNLTLEVLGRRDDGYHEIATILQTIDLYDTLTLEPARETTLECNVPELNPLDNLALRAAHLLMEKTGSSYGTRILLDKKIPVAAGLGGGSSDAAATLLGLNTLWDLGLSVDELTPIAAELGSDVPFFLHGGTAIAHGRGERVRPLPPADLKWLVIVTPAINLPRKTAALFATLSPGQYTEGQLTRKLEARIRCGGDVPPKFLFNAFDYVARRAFPGLASYWETFESLAAREIHAVGSGPSLFAASLQKEAGTALSLMLRHRHGWQSHLVPPWQPHEDKET